MNWKQPFQILKHKLVSEVKDSADDSYGRCYNEWFLKVVASYNQLEKTAGDNPAPHPLPRFLDRINTPEKLENYLTSISVSDIRKTGVDNDREYNEMHATLLEMIIKGSPQNYTVDSTFKKSLLNMLFNKLRNPVTGWWVKVIYVTGISNLLTI